MTERRALLGLLLLALGLRLLGAARAELSYDEALIWSFASEISLAPDQLELVPRSADHPPLGAYLAWLSSRLFGTNDLGLRLLHLLCGVATVLVVHLLGRELWGPRVGLLAAGLLAVDQFHVSWSRLIVETGPLLLFGSLTLLCWWRALESGHARWWLGAGAALGLAYLTKETALLLVPALGLTLLWDARLQQALRRRGPYLAAVVCALLVLPDVLWAVGHAEQSYVGRDASFLADPGLTLKGVSLYLGELFRLLINGAALDTDYGRVAARAVFWPVGLLYVVAIAAMARRGNEATRLLLSAFCVATLAVSVIGGSSLFDPYWWGSLSLLPAVLLTGAWLSERLPGSRSRWLILALALLAAWNLTWLASPGEAAPRLTRPQWAERIAADGVSRWHAGDHPTALAQARFALMLDPGCAAARQLVSELEETGDTKQFPQR